MGIFDRRCRSCDSKDREIASLERQLEWARNEISAQNKRLVEITAPRANLAIAASERAPRRFVPAGPPPPTFPGDYVTPPPTLVEVDVEG